MYEEVAQGRRGALLGTSGNFWGRLGYLWVISYLVNIKNSALGHFWENFLGGMGVKLTSKENYENYG